MRRFREIGVIVRKEFLDAFRNRLLPVTAGVIAALLLTAGLVGWHDYQKVSADREGNKTIVRDLFLSQPDRHPHRVMHYGDVAIKPKSAFSSFDFGIESYTGSAVLLEAHRQNTENFSEAGHSTSLLRFGEMTMALALQVFVPLLISFFCFSAVTREKEEGTLPMLLSQGISMRTILLGKIGGGLLVIFAVVVPPIALFALLLSLMPGFEIDREVVTRAVFLTGAYGLYFCIWVAGAVLVSSLHRQSRHALLTLLGIWVLGCVLMPKSLPALANRLYPAPSKAEFDAHIHEAVQKGIDGHNPADPRVEILKKALLAQYGVERIEALPINFGGVLMRVGEAHSAAVYREHYGRLQEIYMKQNRLTGWAGLVNPYLAVRNLSMGLSGTDYFQFVDFQRKAEGHRIDLMLKLTDLHAQEIKLENDRAQRIDRGHWETLPVFLYRPPDAASTLSEYRLDLFSLFSWCLLMTVFTVGLPQSVINLNK
ncbi:MAG: DUF3526 domain-containing protein [Candidatus Manganitrophaceae bacterium]